MTTFIFYGLAMVLTGASALADKKKTKIALKKAFKAFITLLPALVPMILFVGLMLTLIPQSLISRLLGDESGLFGIALGSILGSIIFMPSFVTFSLGENLLNGGAGYPQVAIFVATLMAVGISSLSVELKYFDKKLSLLRNLSAYLAAILFTLLIGVVY